MENVRKSLSFYVVLIKTRAKNALLDIINTIGFIYIFFLSETNLEKILGDPIEKFESKRYFGFHKTRR